MSASATGFSIEFLTQACASVRTGSVDVVSDPWFSGPTHLGSWRSYPELTAAELEEVRARIDRATHIYISHDHSDHFDPRFLAGLSRKTLLVGDFRNARLREALHALTSRHELICLPTGREIELAPGVRAQILMEHPPFRTNSMMLITNEVGAVLNANDCGLNSAQLRQVSRRHRVRVFMSTLNYLANGYPFPYLRRGDPDLDVRVAEVRQAILSSFRTALDILKPTLAVAFAGPITFADSVNSHLNAYRETLDWSPMVAVLNEQHRVVWPSLRSKVEVDLDEVAYREAEPWSQWLSRRPPSPTVSGRLEPPARGFEADLQRAAQSFLDRIVPAIADSNQKVSLPLILSTVARLEDLEQGPHLDRLRIDLAVPGGRFERLPAGSPPAAPYLHIVSTPELVRDFLLGRVTLDDLLLSACARFSRDPDAFNSTLHNFLRFGHDTDSMQALIEWYRRSGRGGGTMEIVVNGTKRRIPRVCPHEGESLSQACVEKGVLVCPRHKWAFELETGYCIAGGDPGINLYALASEEES